MNGNGVECRGIVIRYRLIVGVSVGVCERRMSNVELRMSSEGYG